MKLNSFACLPSICLALLLVAAACKGPETTVVRQNPTPTTPDTAVADTTTGEPSAAFLQINIGEINPIPTLDPLFAENASTMRALQLVYEGLVRYNQEGSLIPGLAKEWNVSSDSLTYRFILRDNVFYHDSNAFSNGIGRKFAARDVKFAFERMAKINVPGYAAQLFMDIEGFEPYHQEQHYLFNTEQRILNGISGIKTPNDSTVVFKLFQKDKNFLQKLASPYAVIYPREAIVNNNSAEFKAVGTGPFTLSQQRGDSVYIFAKFKDYYNSEQPVVNRVDVKVTLNESGLLKSFTSGDVDVIPELGPLLMKDLLDGDANLQANYASSYGLQKPDGKTYYTLNYNRNAGLPEEQAQLIGQTIDSTYNFTDLQEGFIRFMNFSGESSSNNFSIGDTLGIAKSTDTFSRQFVRSLRNNLQQKGVTLQMHDIRVPTRNTGLYMHLTLPLYPGQSWPYGLDHYTLGGFSTSHLALSAKNIENLSFNNYPWWIDLRTVTLPSN